MTQQPDSTMEEDLVPHTLLKRVRPSDNGRLEVTWRIYDALCNIPTGDLTDNQRLLISSARKAAYENWVIEGTLMNYDGLQGERGYAAAKRIHILNLKSKRGE